MRFVRVLRHAPYLGRVTSIPALPGVGGAVLDAASSLARAPRLLASARFGHVAWIHTFDRRFDRLLAGAEEDYPLVGRRSAAFLQWRFLGNPTAELRIATLVRRSALRAYAVVERDGDVAFIRDLFGYADELGALLEQLAPVLRAEGASSISFRFLGDERVRRVLLAQGFIARDATRAVCFDAGPSLAHSTAPALDRADRWFVTDYDEDV
jgi:hypothetical protein